MIKMTDLAKAFESLGFSNVKTLIQSGNVIFESAPKGEEKLTNEIAKKLGSDGGLAGGCIRDGSSGT